MKKTASKSLTLRLNDELQGGLDHLSKLLKRPKNKIINDAVAFYMKERGTEIQADISKTLAGVRRYQAEDPGFEKAILAVAEAESAYGKDDPAEGTLSPDESGPVSQEINALLHA